MYLNSTITKTSYSVWMIILPGAGNKVPLNYLKMKSNKTSMNSSCMHSLFTIAWKQCNLVV